MKTMGSISWDDQVGAVNNEKTRKAKGVWVLLWRDVVGAYIKAIRWPRKHMNKKR